MSDVTNVTTESNQSGMTENQTNTLGKELEQTDVVSPRSNGGVIIEADIPKQRSKSTSEKYEPISKIKDYLSNYYAFQYNSISNKIEYSERKGNLSELTDNKVNSIYLELQKEMPFRVSMEMLRRILSSDFVPTYNPFKEYFDGLSAWDGETDYIAQIAGRLTTDNPNFDLFFRRWFIGIVACALLNDTANHTVLLLSGVQGIGKTRFLRNLLPARLSNYLYEGHINPNNKEHERHLAERFLILLDEFDSKTERHMESLKSFITREKIVSRKPYAAIPENMNRVASFAGTTNKAHFLKDQSGSRRFIVVNVTEIDTKSFEYLDLAYAQAFALWRSGERFYLNSEEIAMLNEQNQDAMEINVEEEILLDLVERYEEDETDRRSYSATTIAEYVASNSKLIFSSALVQKVGTILMRYDFPNRKSNGRKLYDLKLVSKK